MGLAFGAGALLQIQVYQLDVYYGDEILIVVQICDGWC